MINTITLTDRNGASASLGVATGNRLLHAGLAAGLGLPHECASGTCGSCRATLVEGEVARLWPQAPGARRFRSDREVLLCQAGAVCDAELTLRGTFEEAGPIRPGFVAGRLSPAQFLTRDVARLRLELDRPMIWRSGQFVLVELPGVEGPRAYSMTGRGGEAEVLDLLLRRKEGGACSQQVLREGGAHMPVRVFGPLGRAVFDARTDRTLVAIAGGSGIAGIMSILAEASASGHLARHPCRLHFGLRTPEESYLLDELDGLAASHREGLEIEIAFSDGEADEALRARHPALQFTGGFVHERAGARLVAQPAPPDATFFVAGPPAMVDAAMKTLVMGHGIDAKRVRYDRFG